MGVLRCDVAIVGGGASGALVAVGLLRRAISLSQREAVEADAGDSGRSGGAQRADRRTAARTGPAPIGGPWTIALIDAEGAFARGVAYSTTEPRHVLNVPAGKMGADPRDVGGFLRWANARGVLAGPGDFLPRMLYGEYLDELVRDAERASPAKLIRVKARVERAERAAAMPAGVEAPVGARPTKQEDGRRSGERTHTGAGARSGRPSRSGTSADAAGWILHTSGDELHARIVVIATGNLAPANPPVPDHGVYASDQYIASAWRPESLRKIGLDEDVFFIGTGLTTVDALLTLSGRGHRGRLVALSPHGMFPRVHAGIEPSTNARGGGTAADTQAQGGGIAAGTRAQAGGTGQNGDARAAETFDLPHAETPRVRELLARVRELAGSRDWRSVVDALRPHTIPVWRALEVADKRRFLRHLRNFWEVHRHRMAPEVARVLDGLRERRQLEIVVGRLASFERDGGDGVIVRYRPRGATTESSLHVARVVNCTGPRPPFVSTETFFASLLQQGFVRPDPLRLGFDTVDGALVDARDQVSRDLFAIGPLRRGELWETTAIPEIRVQADALAERLAEELRPDAFAPAANQV